VPRPPRVSPYQIAAAAATEFADRGYAGARVDRIARKARVNKAMLYYHFGSKQNLYRAVLRGTFEQIAAILEAIADGPGTPEQRLDAAVAAMAAFIDAHQHFPSIMLREVADRGVHLDGDTIAALAAVPRAFGRIIGTGIETGAFRPMHPLAAYFTTIAPILMFVASTPLRQKLSPRQVAAAPIAAADFVQQFQRSLQRAFAATPREMP
jgi:TetR/AcrR family transcriptional regulator